MNRPSDLRPSPAHLIYDDHVVLAFFIECACPPERRSATVGAGQHQSVEEFLADYSLTHIVCQTCNSYYRLIGFIDSDGNETRIESQLQAPVEVARKRRRLAMSSTRPGSSLFR